MTLITIIFLFLLKIREIFVSSKIQRLLQTFHRKRLLLKNNSFFYFSATCVHTSFATATARLPKEKVAAIDQTLLQAITTPRILIPLEFSRKLITDGIIQF